MSTEIRRTLLHRTGFVSVSILGWQSHVAFRVDGIVVVPVSHRRNGHSGFEAARVRHRVAGHEAAIAPSPPAETIAVELRETIQCLIERSELVVEFDFPKLVPQRSRELLTAKAHTAVIDTKHRDAVMRKNLIEEEARRSPVVLHLLRLRTAIRIH